MSIYPVPTAVRLLLVYSTTQLFQPGFLLQFQVFYHCGVGDDLQGTERELTRSSFQ